jgi:hypothetical protein
MTTTTVEPASARQPDSLGAQSQNPASRFPSAVLPIITVARVPPSSPDSPGASRPTLARSFLPSVLMTMTHVAIVSALISASRGAPA